MDDMERYEADRQENAVNERWQEAEDLGYSHGTCRIHGGFWTDSGDGCPSCTPEPEEEQADADMAFIDAFLQDHEPATNDQVCLELMLESWQTRIERAARETTQGSFLMAAMRRNGIFHE